MDLCDKGAGNRGSAQRTNSASNRQLISIPPKSGIYRQTSCALPAGALFLRFLKPAAVQGEPTRLRCAPCPPRFASDLFIFVEALNCWACGSRKGQP